MLFRSGTTEQSHWSQDQLKPTRFPPKFYRFSVAKKLFHRSDLLSKRLLPIGAGVELERCVKTRGSHAVQLGMTRPHTVHHLVPWAFDRCAIGTQLVGQAQYDYTTASGRQSFIVGADIEMIRPDTRGTIQTDEGIDEIGGYLQSTTNLTSKLDFTAAVRADYSSIGDEGINISPRVAIVFKPDNSNSFRVTFNRAYSSHGTNSNFLNIIAGQIPGTSMFLRGRRAAEGYTLERN